MKKLKSDKLGIALTIIALLILIALTNDNRTFLSLPEKILNNIISPVQNSFIYLKNKLTKNTTFFESIENLKEENASLKQEILELEENLRELEIIKAENTSLKESMDLTEKYIEYNTVPAQIINTSFENYSNILIINVGENDGIKKDMPVIASEGLVGRIISVDSTTSKVLTIIDPTNSVSAKTSTTRESVICKGNIDIENTILLKYISTDTTLTLGDTVETSGMGGIYPKGIIIGTISEIKNSNNKLEEYAIITPAVDFNKLETVLVIKD